MAPSRRRGTSKAAAAAAVCRQWKVGDLVLAKVKGFPAWPAKVSEPEKWGYSNDWKKVLVYFFGTQQIAFCNPADVEAFTEEKKQSLVKRHGRGADFVRAVHEIIDSYEKLKKESQVDETSSVGEATNANVSNPVDPSANAGLKDQTHAPLTLNSQMKSSNSVFDRHEPGCATEDDSATVLKDESYNKEASLEEHNDNVVATVKSHLPVTYCSRKKSANMRLQVYVTHRNAPVGRSRNSSQVQNFVVPCSDSGNDGGNSGDISADSIHNVSIKRNKHISKSPDLLGCEDADSSAFASSNSMEEYGSEILTIDSDAFSLNEGSTTDSNSKLEHSKTIDCPEGEVELSKGLDLEIKAVINKKKRKPNRKKVTNDAAKLTIRQEEVGVQNGSQSSQNMYGNSKERCSEQDGDEYLPLLKRARVRMGKSSSTEAELNSIVQVQEKSCKEDIINSPQKIIISSNCENGSPADGDSSALNGALDNVSPSKLLAFASGSQICKIKKDQMFGCSLDGEAALPPSKRLHRALEAMSANAAEEGQTHTESSSSIMPSIGRCFLSAIKRCPCMAIKNQGGNGLEPQGLDSCGIDCSHISVSASSNPMFSTESSAEADKQLTKFLQHETGKDVLPGARDQIGEDRSDFMVCQTTKSDSVIQLHGKISPNLNVECCEVGSNQDSLGPSLPPNDDDNIRPVNHSNASDTSEHNGISLDPVAVANESGKLFPQNSINVPQNDVVCEDTWCLKQAVGDSRKINDIHEVVEEVKFKGQEEDMNSVSISSDCLGEKGTLGIWSSPSLTDGGGCLPQGSPPNTSVCNLSTSDSSNILQNGSCSHDVHQKHTLSGPVNVQKDGSVANQRSCSTGKLTEAGHTALLYFEAMLGTLTRTKESIGRATRIAIDCAKFGIAAKVVEILVHNLETESSLHRRVDLFFLVDSVAQCSRGLKGDGGLYPSAMQAVLPRLLSAAPPPRNTAQENRRQCLKVLWLWLERRILPESIICHHIQQLESYSSSASAGVFSRRSLRTERALDDPVREMEGMLVDEYGSNSSFQLPGFCMPRMLKDEDEGSDSDEGNFEAVTPEHDSEMHEVQETAHVIRKHRHVLEDVDGELEMEDVAPSFDVELNSICNVDGGNARQCEKNLPLSFASPLQQYLPTSSPPPPPLPPPLPPPPPPKLHLMSATSDPYDTAGDSKVYTDSQTVKDNTAHSRAQPLAAPRNSQPISHEVHYRVPECRDMQIKIPESTCSVNTFPVQPPDNFRNSDGVTMHNKSYLLRPPHHMPFNQFSFVHGDRVKPQREVPPPPSYSIRHQFVQNTKRENFYNNHERLKPPSYDYRERRNDVPPPYSGARYHDKGVPSPYDCHPCESTRLSGHGWRFPPHSMNYGDSMPFRPPFEDAIPVANRGPNYWRPR